MEPIVTRSRYRCAACGRFRRRVPDDLCGRCRDRGYVALRLFDPDALDAGAVAA